MTVVFVGLFLVITGFLIWRARATTNPTEQACAKAIGHLFRGKREVSKQSIADVFVRYGVTRDRCSSVGRMVIGQLQKQGLEPDDSRIAMIKVREAYSLVPTK